MKRSSSYLRLCAIVIGLMLGKIRSVGKGMLFILIIWLILMLLIWKGFMSFLLLWELESMFCRWCVLLCGVEWCDL